MPLTGKQRRYLRALAHPLSPVVQIGHQGVTDALVAKVDLELDQHELIKVKVGESPVDAREAAPVLAQRTRSEVAQIIGKTIVLYRRRPQEPEIELPRA